MKILILLIISFFLFLFSGEKKNNDLIKDNIKGKVKRVELVVYKINLKKGKDTIRLLQSKTTTQYDSNGNAFKMQRFTSDSVIPLYYSVILSDDSITKSKYIYGKNGNIIEKDDSSFWGNIQHHYRYDIMGKLISDTSWVDSNANVTYVYYSYNEKNNLVEEDIDFAEPMKYVYKYDNENKLVEMDFSMKYRLCEKSIYNASGNVTDFYSLFNQKNDSVVHCMSYVYKSFDRKKNWIKRFDYGKKETLMEIRKIVYY